MLKNPTIVRARVKATRFTPHSSARFGAGLLAWTPYVGRVSFTTADQVEAAQMFADAAEPDWDALAGEAAAVDRMGRGVRLA